MLIFGDDKAVERRLARIRRPWQAVSKLVTVVKTSKCLGGECPRADFRQRNLAEIFAKAGDDLDQEGADRRNCGVPLGDSGSPVGNNNVRPGLLKLEKGGLDIDQVIFDQNAL